MTQFIVLVMPKDGINNPEGTAILRASRHLGFSAIDNIRMGKAIKVTFAEDEVEVCREKLEKLCEELLVNHILEDYSIELFS